MKKASLNLSVNAIVVLILAITMLGLALGFINMVFSQAEGLTQDNFEDLNTQRLNNMINGCDDHVCLESRRMKMEKNEEEDLILVVNNKFDCDLTPEIKVGYGGDYALGGVEEGSNEVGCQIVGNYPQADCSDISINAVKDVFVEKRNKEFAVFAIEAQSSAEPTEYTYEILVEGECTVEGNPTPFEMSERKRLSISIEG